VSVPRLLLPARPPVRHNLASGSEPGEFTGSEPSPVVSQGWRPPARKGEVELVQMAAHRLLHRRVRTSQPGPWWRSRGGVCPRAFVRSIRYAFGGRSGWRTGSQARRADEGRTGTAGSRSGHDHAGLLRRGRRPATRGGRGSWGVRHHPRPRDARVGGRQGVGRCEPR